MEHLRSYAALHPAVAHHPTHPNQNIACPGIKAFFAPLWAPL